MNWIPLQAENELEQIITDSETQPVLLYKHSTTCSISATALGRLERNWKTDAIKPYYLDLLRFRELSRQVAERFGVTHQSPQALLIYKGQCVYDASHFDIRYDELMAKASVSVVG